MVVPFETGIVVSTSIESKVGPVLAVGQLRGRLGVGRLGLITLATLVTAKGAFATTASGQRKLVCVIARLGRAFSFPRQAAAIQQRPGRASVGEATRENLR